MKNYIFKTLKHPLFSGSLVMIVGSNAVSFLNYIYHFIMGRLLGPSAYGELIALISLMGLLFIIPGALSLALTKRVSSAEKEDVVNLISWLNNKTIWGSLIIFLAVVATVPFTNGFLNLSQPILLILVALIISFSLPNSLNRAILQGLTRFPSLVLSTFIETGAKLILGVLFVYWGFSTGGALLGFVIATFFAWLITRRFLSDYIKNDVEKVDNLKSLFTYSFPVLLQSLAITSLYSADLLLVKHFFTPHEAGIYASVATLGKIIFFATAPITTVMFPMVAKKHAKGESYNSILFYSVALVLLLSSVIVFLYWLLPNLAVNSLYGSSYLAASPYLVSYGIFMIFFSLVALLINFYLSVGKTRVVLLPIMAAVAQIIGIWFYHLNIQSVILVSITVTALLLLGLLIYFPYATKTGFRDRSSL